MKYHIPKQGAKLAVRLTSLKNATFTAYTFACLGLPPNSQMDILATPPLFDLFAAILEDLRELRDHTEKALRN